ncbi:hypothetical protein JTB14_011226 [Gonioctena quinquepunctata]|nr:hypothetical protein JTB14_011226 [Gonioctena quinquepunctata]
MDSLISFNESQNRDTKENLANQNDSGCETSTIKSVDGSQAGEVVKITTFPGTKAASESNDDIVILRRDPATNRKLIDKSAYAKLQRSLSPTRNSNPLSSLKEKYESDRRSIERKPKLKRASAIKVDEAALHSLRNKSKLPVAKARSAVKSEIFISHSKPVESAKLRHTLNLDQNTNTRDENSNELFRKSSSSSGDFITIVTRSESEGSVDKLGRELDLFTMERKPKEKKRSNSFKKIFSGRIFSKDKKKKDEEQNKLQHKDNVANSDTMQNETNTFARDSPYRHTTGGKSNLPKPTRMSRIDRDRQTRAIDYDVQEIEKQYAQMHVREFNNIKQTFDKTHSDTNEKPIITNNPGPLDYKNMPNINKFIDTSSSVSTLGSDRSHKQSNVENETLNRFTRFGENHRENNRDTPPRAQELRQDVRLPEAESCIKNNHYDFKMDGANGRTNSPRFEEAYGTVFDSVANKTGVIQRSAPIKFEQKPPKSPSLELTKLRLPSDREITPLSPRMKSPIPQHHVSTEKMIATELLKPRSRSPTPTRKKTSQLSPSHQKLEIGIDYPEYMNTEKSVQMIDNALTSKPPISRVPERNPLYAQRISEESPSQENRMQQMRPPSVAGSQERIFTNVLVHPNSTNTRTPTPNSLLHNRSLSPMGPQSLRSSTPDMRASSSNKSQSPQKEEIRRCAEVQKFFAELQRNGRRSLSLPRDPKPPAGQVEVTDGYGRFQPTSIPEGRAVVNQPNGAYYHTNFRRNTPERRTIDSLPRTNGNYSNSVYRPIFKRGSLTTPVRELSEDQQNKKVSFGSSREDPRSNQSWPTRNGFTQSPPQRRIDSNRLSSVDDDVFLPNPPQNSRLIVDGREIYGYANRPYGSRQMLPQEEVFYGQAVDALRLPYGMTRHGSIQLEETAYGQQRVPRRMSQDSTQGTRQGTRHVPVQNPGYTTPRRQIIMRDDIYGQFGGYIPENPNEQPNLVYSSRQNIVESPYGYAQGSPKQVSVKNKVCDIYGQIHDGNSPSLAKPNNLKQSGVILGQLQSSPQMVRQSHSQLPNQNFVRNSRLTASANDMYRRYQSVDPRYVNGVGYGQYPVREDLAPTRPLPPVPTGKNVITRPGFDCDSEGSAIHSVNSINGKSKKRGLFGSRILHSSPSQLDEETKRLSTSKLERLVLLEKLQLLRLEQQVEIEKSMKRTEPHPSGIRSAGTQDEYLHRRKQVETEETKKLRLPDLRRVVLLEELQLIRMKLSIEPIYKNVQR